MFHPFYVRHTDKDSGGFVYDGEWKAASNLLAGDVLQKIDGSTVYVTEVTVEKLPEIINVYNLEIEDLHAYYVADGVLVHNECDSDGSSKVEESDSNTGLKEFDIAPYGKFKDYPGDGLTGHELLQNAWLEANGKITKRGVGLSTKNPAIALFENPIHKFISGQQKSLGLNKKNLAGTSWRKNVLDNIQIMKEAGVPRAKIAELAWQTRKFAIDNGF